MAEVDQRTSGRRTERNEDGGGAPRCYPLRRKGPSATIAMIGGAAAFCAIALWPSAAQADPQGTVGLTIGVAGAGYDRAIWDDTLFHLGLRGDVLFGRSQNSDFGIGPYAEVATHAFDELQFGGGASFLIPILDTFPLVLSGGAYGRAGDDDYGLEPGVAGELFWGTRSYNYHSSYVMTAGLLGEFRYGLGDSRETSIVIAAQLDLAVIALPFVFLFNAARGGSKDTEPVR